MKKLSKNSGVTIHRRHLYSSELRMVEELDLSDYPMLAICRDMFMTQYRTGLKFTKMMNRAKRLDESARGIYAAFLSMKQDAYVDGIIKLIEMIVTSHCLDRLPVDGNRDASCAWVINVTPDIGYYTNLSERICRSEISLLKAGYAIKKTFVSSGIMRDKDEICQRDYLTEHELNLVEGLNITKHSKLYRVWKIFCASCKTLKTVNHIVKHSITTFSDPAYKVYADNDNYLRDLHELLDAAGIRTYATPSRYHDDGTSYKSMDLLLVTPNLGRNTFMHNELRPTNRK